MKSMILTGRQKFERDLVSTSSSTDDASVTFFFSHDCEGFAAVMWHLHSFGELSWHLSYFGLVMFDINLKDRCNRRQ